jgi:hypothetical protein
MVTRGGGLCTSVHEKHPVVVTHAPALTRRRNNLRTSSFMGAFSKSQI